MRWTSFFSPTLRDAPGDAEAESHKLLVRGGYIRQLHSGHYILLPLAHRVRKKIITIIEEEMDGIGGATGSDANVAASLYVAKVRSLGING